MPGPRPQQAANGPVQTHRRDNIVPERGHDAYRPAGRLSDPSVCPRCEAVFREGKWRWMPPPSGANTEICPACRRTEDDYPAGFLTLASPFLAEHKAEVVNLIRNEESAEKQEHPLNRIMKLDDQGEVIEITTTDVHLPRRIGEAVHRAYKGELELRYADDETSVRIRWER